MTDANTPLARARGFLLDLDGTLYLGGRLIPGAARLLATLQRLDLPFVCLTNNSSTRGSSYVAKLQHFGLPVEPRHVLTSGQATLHHLLSATPHRSAYVVGTPPLVAEFAEGGMTIDEGDPDCVVLGYDTTLTYHKLCVATRLVLRGKPYFATHPDRTCITEQGLLPDIAAVIAGLQAVTGRSPTVLGKPEQPMVQAGSARLGVPVDRLVMVGDQLDTDMTMALTHGLTAVLVLSGETNERALEESTVAPHLVLRNVDELAARLDALTAVH